MKKIPLRLVIILSFLSVAMLETHASDTSGTYIVTHPQFNGPFAYKDAKSGIIFYVESDGRHVAAMDSGGKLLWTRDPFVEAKLEPYQLARPKIVQIGVPLDWMVRGREGQFICVRFNSTQTGIMSVSTGAFVFLGQD